jgi:hypothetical protein
MVIGMDDETDEEEEAQKEADEESNANAYYGLGILPPDSQRGIRSRDGSVSMENQISGEQTFNFPEGQNSVAASSVSSIHTPVTLGPLQTRLTGKSLPKDMDMFFKALEDMVAESNVEEALAAEQEALNSGQALLRAHKGSNVGSLGKPKNAPIVKSRDHLDVCPWEDPRDKACPWNSFADLSSEQDVPVASNTLPRKEGLSLSFPTLKRKSSREKPKSKSSIPSLFSGSLGPFGNNSASNSRPASLKLPVCSSPDASSAGSSASNSISASRSSSFISTTGSVGGSLPKSRSLPSKSQGTTLKDLAGASKCVSTNCVNVRQSSSSNLKDLGIVSADVMGSLDSGYGSYGKLAGSLLIKTDRLDDRQSEEEIFGLTKSRSLDGVSVKNGLVNLGRG